MKQKYKTLALFSSLAVAAGARQFGGWQQELPAASADPIAEVGGQPAPWLTQEGQAALRAADVSPDRTPAHAMGRPDPHAGLAIAPAYPNAPPATTQPDPHTHARYVSALPSGTSTSCDKSRAANGYTVASLYASRTQLQSSKVRVRGTVTKVTPGIRGNTYLHVRDGSGSMQSHDNDLTVVTTQSVEVGQVLEWEGKVALEQDLGFGYRYDLLLQEAVIVTSA